MSTGASCYFDQTGPNTWRYLLQRYPYGETRDYNEYGPFETFEEAHDHLGAHHANPGGFTVNTLEGYECPHDLTTETKTIEFRDGKGFFVPAMECRRCGELV